MAKPRAAKRAPAPSKTPPVAEHFLTGSPAAAYTYFVPAAQALPPERVRSFRIDLTNAQNNLALGLQAVLPELPRLIKELPALPIAELAELQARFAAVRHATARLADLGPGSSDSFEIRYARARELREPLLDFAEVLVQLKLFPGGRVSSIRAGSGAFDAGQDCIDLVDLFTEFAAALTGKSPFDAAYLEATQKAGLALTRITTPSGGRTAASNDLVTAVDIKNRLWTLFDDSYQVLRKAGFYLFGDRVDDFVPLLGSRQRTTSAAADPAPTPEADPGTDPSPEGGAAVPPK